MGHFVEAVCSRLGAALRALLREGLCSQVGIARKKPLLVASATTFIGGNIVERPTSISVEARYSLAGPPVITLACRIKESLLLDLYRNTRADAFEGICSAS